MLTVLDESGTEMAKALKKLETDTNTAEAIEDHFDQAVYYKDTILEDMDELRKYADQAEAMIPDDYLGYPTYGQMLFSLR